MSDLLHSSRVRALLAAIDQANSLLERIDERHRPEVARTLEALYKDLGRSVHAWASRTRAPVVPSAPPVPHPSPDHAPPREPVPAEVQVEDSVELESVEEPPSTEEIFLDEDLSDEPTEGQRITSSPPKIRQAPRFIPTLELEPEPAGPPGFDDYWNTDFRETADDQPTEEHDDRWFTEEVEPDGPLFSPAELVEAEPVPSSAEPDAPEALSIDAVERMQRPTGVRPGQRLPSWLVSLDATLTILQPVEALTKPSQLATEAVRVQLATAAPERWRDAPPPVQVAVVGMLAARARVLEARLPVAVGPRLALARLRQYRTAADLPAVGPLTRRGPETGSWESDASRWWSVVQAAL